MFSLVESPSLKTEGNDQAPRIAFQHRWHKNLLKNRIFLSFSFFNSAFLIHGLDIDGSGKGKKVGLHIANNFTLGISIVELKLEWRIEKGIWHAWLADDDKAVVVKCDDSILHGVVAGAAPRVGFP